MADLAGENAVENMAEDVAENVAENVAEDLAENVVENKSEEQPVSREEYEQAMGALAEAQKELRAQTVERELERLLREAGAKNQQAVRGLLPVAELLGANRLAEQLPEGWQEELQQQVAALQEAPETAFLFGSAPEGMQGWVGFVPAETDEIDQREGGLRLRLAQARGEQDSLAAIRVKQEAAARGVFL